MRDYTVLQCTDDNHKAVNVSLTAYVTIALHELRNFEGVSVEEVMISYNLSERMFLVNLNSRYEC